MIDPDSGKPGSPGLYWARPCHSKNPEWTVVHVRFLGPPINQYLIVEEFGDESIYDLDDYTWGPKIPKPEGDPNLGPL